MFRLNNLKSSSEYICISLALCSISILSALILASSTTSADVVDDVTITVPVSCNMTSELDTAHTATINPGQYQSDIGTTNFTVFCNDNSGYAIYAIGYSNEEYGNTKMLATIGNQLAPTYDINTGTNTSGANSSWSMKLIPVTGTYAPTIENGFANYHIVPEEYTKVATFASNTDFTIGSSLQSTYQVYIDGNKPAGTYAGKVKYTLVHPNDGVAPLPAGKIGVQYNANGSTFSGGATKNEVIYQENCDTMYQGNTPTISKTPNVNNDGIATTGYAYDFTQKDPVTFSGASKLKIELQYGIEGNYDYLYIFQGTYSGEVTGGENAPMEAGQMATYTGGNGSGDTQFTPGESTTLYVDGDTVTFAFFGDDYADDGYYGYYAKVYPVYTTEQPDITADTICGITAETGTYVTTTDWYGSWYADINGIHYDFTDEAEVKSFLEDNASTLSGTTISLMRGLTFAEAYDKAGKTLDSGYYKQQELTKSMCDTIAITQNQTLKDVRDSNTYLVGKLKDGNCWMLDNLALDPTNPTTAANMNENNTNATQVAINNLIYGGSSATGWSNVPVADIDANFNSYTEPRINNASRNTVATNYGEGSGEIGLYYNYCAASAGTYCYDNGQGIDLPDTITDATQDICPANWRMPTGGNNNSDYSNLYNAYSASTDAQSVDSLQYNLSIPLSGYYTSSWVDSLNLGGYWWSSTYDSSYNMSLLGTDSFYAAPDYSYSRYIGATMRCLLSS